MDTLYSCFCCSALAFKPAKAAPIVCLYSPPCQGKFKKKNSPLFCLLIFNFPLCPKRPFFVDFCPKFGIILAYYRGPNVYHSSENLRKHNRSEMLSKEKSKAKSNEPKITFYAKRTQFSPTTPQKPRFRKKRTQFKPNFKDPSGEEIQFKPNFKSPIKAQRRPLKGKNPIPNF